jgi:hypothetical protein
MLKAGHPPLRLLGYIAARCTLQVNRRLAMALHIGGLPHVRLLVLLADVLLLTAVIHVLIQLLGLIIGHDSKPSWLLPVLKAQSLCYLPDENEQMDVQMNE